MQIFNLKADSPQLVFDNISFLFKEMYEYFNEIENPYNLSENGELLWLKSIRNLLNRINIVFYATEKDKIIGFSAGNIKILPSYLGEKKIGFISHIYIKPSNRGTQASKNLVSSLENWFYENNCQEIELEVLIKNDNAIKFWEKFGYKTNLLKMKK